MSLNGVGSFYKPIRSEFAAFRRCFRAELNSRDRLIAGIHAHLLKMQGKCLRPALAILSSCIAGRKPTDVIPLAVAIELIHTATLVHDDIIDGSSFRRDQPSVPSRWGTEISIVSGDYLYSKAFRLLASLEDRTISRSFARCAQSICEGEIKQIEKRHDFLIPRAEYYKIIRQKTAALFQVACAAGASLSGAPAPMIKRMSDYGLSLGLAFQIVDDCLDLTSDKKSLGKSAGLDIDRSDASLPILVIFESLHKKERLGLLKAFEDKAPDLRKKVLNAAARVQAVETSMAVAKRFARAAEKSLTGIPESVYKQSLVGLARYCVNRPR